MKKFISLLEELGSYEKEYLRNKLGGDKYNPLTKHKNMFNSYNNINQNRIVLPLESSNLNDKVDTEIKTHLKNNGWDVHNYNMGLASRQVKDRDGNDKLEVRKIGKVLQQTGGDKINHSQLKDRLIKGSNGKPVIGSDGRYKSEKVKQSLSDFYNSDPIRDSSKIEHNIVISRDLDDIGGMTSGRDWENDSCMQLPNGWHDGGGFHEKIKADLAKHTLVAYAAKKGDDDLENPVGRVLIKRYKSNTKVDGKHHYIYRPEHDTYGNPPDGFTGQVESLMNEHYPAHKDVGYSLDRSLYNDGRRDIEPYKSGLYKNDDGYENYNSSGKLHDFIDEHGIKQPAVKQNNGNYTHYKDGELHNESGIAMKLGNRNSHYIDGALHREGDLPAVYSDDGNHEEYHVGGVLHRDGNKPAFTVKNGETYLEQRFMKNGLFHREGDLPAHTLKSTAVTKEVYYKNGLLHRDGDKPADTNIYKLPHESTTNLIYAKDGEKTKKEFIYENPHRYNEHTITTYDKHGEIETEHSIKGNRSIITNNLATGNNPSKVIEDPDSIMKEYNSDKGLKSTYESKDGIYHEHEYHGITTTKDNHTKTDKILMEHTSNVYVKNKDGLHYIDAKNNMVTTLKPDGTLLHSKDSYCGTNDDDTLEYHHDNAVQITKNKLAKFKNNDLDVAEFNEIPEQHFDTIKQFKKAAY